MPFNSKADEGISIRPTTSLHSLHEAKARENPHLVQILQEEFKATIGERIK